jgi:hypothetical protein
MERLRALAFAVLILLPIGAAASVARNPLDVSGMNQAQAEKYFESILGKELTVPGVVKDASDMRIAPSSMLYEIPAYRRDGSGYVKYGIVCQKSGESRIIFADDGYLSQYVKTNALDHPVLAQGELIKGGRIVGLPHGMVFIIDSLNLQEGKGEN